MLRPLSTAQSYTPLTDAQWYALLPHLLPRSPQGRRIADLRNRMNAIFHLAHTNGEPWKNIPARYGNADTIARTFRRLTHAGLWHRLLQALAQAPRHHPLRTLENAICRATRRAARLGGIPLNRLIRTLGYRKALNGPPWLLPDPLLSEILLRIPPLPHFLTTKRAWNAAIQRVRSLRALLRTAGGRPSIPRYVRWLWA